MNPKAAAGMAHHAATTRWNNRSDNPASRRGMKGGANETER